MRQVTFTPEEELLLQEYVGLCALEDQAKWRKYRLMAKLCAQIPDGLGHPYRKAAQDYIGQSTIPPAPRTMQDMARTWNIVPEELRDIVNPSKALLVVQATKRQPPEVVEEWIHRAVGEPFAVLKDSLEKEFKQPLRDDVSADTCPTCGKKVRAKEDK